MTILLYTAIALSLGAIAACFISWRWSAAPAAAGMALACIASPSPMPVATLIFWLVTAALAMALNKMLPATVSGSRRGLGYIAGGALAGVFTGYLISRQWMVFGAVTGAFLGAIAYSFTPAGRWLRFPSSEFIQYLCAKGLPSVVTICIAAIATLESVGALIYP